MTEDDQIEALVQYTADEFGAVDIMFSNAGVTDDLSSLADITVEGLKNNLDLSSWITGQGIVVDGGATSFTNDATLGLITQVVEEFA